MGLAVLARSGERMELLGDWPRLLLGPCREEVTGPLERPRKPLLGLVGVTLLFMAEWSEMSGRLFSFLSAWRGNLFLVFTVPSEKLGV